MKEEKTIEQALKDAAEQAGAKPEEMKTVAVEQVAGIHCNECRKLRRTTWLHPGDNDREERGTQRRKTGHGSGKRKL